MTQLWRQQAELNKGHRFPWRHLLGKTLTSKITELRDKGKSPEEIYNIIITEYPITPEAKKRLRISISARCAEQDAFLNQTMLKGFSRIR